MIEACRRKADQEHEQLLKLNEKIAITLISGDRFLSRQSLSFQGDENSEGMIIEKNARAHVSGQDYSILENFVAIVDLLRRRDPVLDQWFKNSSLPPYHVR